MLEKSIVDKKEKKKKKLDKWLLPGGEEQLHWNRHPCHRVRADHYDTAERSVAKRGAAKSHLASDVPTVSLKHVGMCLNSRQVEN